MRDEERIHPGHSSIRGGLRIVGPMITLAGIVFLGIGLVSFFSSFASPGFGPPRYFWCVFVGMLLLAVGGALCKFAFLGAVVRYQAGELAPVGKDTLNYLAHETKDSVETLASAVGRGLAGTAPPHEASGVRCNECGQANDANAKFCDRCGASLSQSIECPACRTANDAAARFCDQCGAAL